MHHLKHMCFNPKWTQHLCKFCTSTTIVTRNFTSPALSSSGTGLRCEPTRQHTNDTTQPNANLWLGPVSHVRKTRNPNKKLKRAKNAHETRKKRKNWMKEIILTKKKEIQHKSNGGDYPHRKRKNSAYQVQTAYQYLHSAYQYFGKSKTISGARKEPAEIIPPKQKQTQLCNQD